MAYKSKKEIENESIILTIKPDPGPNVGEISGSVVVECKVEDVVTKRRRGRPRKITNMDVKSPSSASKNPIAQSGIKAESNDPENVNSNYDQLKKGTGNVHKSKTPRKRPGRPRIKSLETEVTSKNKNVVPGVAESEAVIKPGRGGPRKHPKLRKTPVTRTSRFSPHDSSGCEDEPDMNDEDYVPDPDLSVNDPESFKCHICHKVLSNARSLRRHLRVHTGERPYMCSRCGKLFPEISELHLHEKYHQGEREYKCNYCDYHAYQKVVVTQHEWRQHLIDRTYICDVCGKGFIDFDSLNTHKTSHERDKRFSCDNCDFITHTLEILRRHMKNIHAPREMFTCEICGTKLRYKNTYVMHMRRHKGEKPYMCKVCDKGFTTRSELAAHRKTHVPREHFCQICGKSFLHKSHLRRHSAIHSGEKLHSCPACTYKCNVRSNLKKHCRKVHKLDYPPAREIGRKVLMVASPNKADDEIAGDSSEKIAGDFDESTLANTVS